jgi:hypothetical protein
MFIGSEEALCGERRVIRLLVARSQARRVARQAGWGAAASEWALPSHVNAVASTMLRLPGDGSNAFWSGDSVLATGAYQIASPMAIEILPSTRLRAFAVCEGWR